MWWVGTTFFTSALVVCRIKGVISDRVCVHENSGRRVAQWMEETVKGEGGQYR